MTEFNKLKILAAIVVAFALMTVSVAIGVRVGAEWFARDVASNITD